MAAPEMTVSQASPGEEAAWGRLFSAALFPNPFAATMFLRTPAQALARNLSACRVSRGAEIIGCLVWCGPDCIGASVVTGISATRDSALQGFRSTAVLNLPSQPCIRHSVRRNARKSLRSGARVSTKGDLESCWTRLDRTRSRRGSSIGMSHARSFAPAETIRQAGIAWIVSVADTHCRPAASRIQLSVPGAETACGWAEGSSPAALAGNANPWNVICVMEERRARRYKCWAGAAAGREKCKSAHSRPKQGPLLGSRSRRNCAHGGKVFLFSGMAPNSMTCAVLSDDGLTAFQQMGQG